MKTIPFDEVAPTPWNLLSQGWWLLHYNSSSLDVTQGGYYHPLELEGTQLGPDAQGVFKGGLANAAVYRYLDSPVGPYDELMIIPGKFTNPVNGKSSIRISRIYVSTERSIYNGRKNWNIPKHLAHFKFTSGPSNSTKIEVFLPSEGGEGGKPFFSAICKPASIIPSFPFRTAWSPLSLELVQPPLHPLTEEHKRLLREGENPDTLVPGASSEWTNITPQMSGKIRVCYVEPGLDNKEYADGINFPKFQPWKMALEWLPGMKLVFPTSERVTK